MGKLSPELQLMVVEMFTEPSLPRHGDHGQARTDGLQQRVGSMRDHESRVAEVMGE